MSTQTFKADLFVEFARIGKALSSGNRLEILDFLAQGERSVDNLAAMMKLSVANTSHHLQQLRAAGLVTARKEGLYVFYATAGESVIRLMSALQSAGQEHLAEVDKLVKLYLNSRDDMEPIAANELLARVKKGLVTVLDVRPPEEFKAGHIAGAINVPIYELKKRLHEIPAGQEIVAYCRGPYCLMSFDAVAELRKKGRKVRRFEEGFPEWKVAGLPVETGPQPATLSSRARKMKN